MFECSERHQNSAIRKCRHSPLQTFLGSGRSFANTCTHFPQLLLSVFGRGADVLGNAFRSLFFGSHGFILSVRLLIPRFLQLLSRFEFPDVSHADRSLRTAMRSASLTVRETTARPTPTGRIQLGASPETFLS